MRLLLDSHALLWWFAGDERLSDAARAAIGDAGNAVHVGAATAWELAAKYRLGRLPDADDLLNDLEGHIAGQGFVPLPIGLHHAAAAGRLPGPHRDPFDRMLIAQAMVEDLALVSNEHAFDVYGVRRLW